jgi:hypothetical protein
MSSETPSGESPNWPMLAIVAATVALSTTFLLVGGGFRQQELWSDANRAELAAFDRVSTGEPAAALQPDVQEPSRDPEHPLVLAGG